MVEVITAIVLSIDVKVKKGCALGHSISSILCKTEHWPIKGSFRISRSALTQVTVVSVAISDGTHTGQGECRPYPRYNETAETVRAQIESLSDKWDSLTTETLQEFLPAGAARNAVDCALWDLNAQQTGQSVTDLLDLTPPQTVRTAFTLSLDTPDAMRRASLDAQRHTLLKIKIGDYRNGLDAALAIMDARPDAELIIDANEALSLKEAASLRSALANYPVVLIEQPVPSKASGSFSDPQALPIICADESLHTSDDLPRLWRQGYRAVNIKLDKTGGLTEAVTLLNTARSMGFVIMVGCMVGTSLALAPATLLMGYADVVDLDGALLLSKDREDGLVYDGQTVAPTSQGLWGYPRGQKRFV